MRMQFDFYFKMKTKPFTPQIQRHCFHKSMRSKIDTNNFNFIYDIQHDTLS